MRLGTAPPLRARLLAPQIYRREPDPKARAREQQVEHYVDQMISIADGVANCTDSAIVHAARLAIDTRKWAASKLLPRKYGDRLGVDSTGSLTIKIVHGLGDAPDDV
jgi:hypothetical protein